jgi:hypothetical protein
VTGEYLARCAQKSGQAAAATLELLVPDKPCADFTLYLRWRNPWS